MNRAKASIVNANALQAAFSDDENLSAKWVNEEFQEEEEERRPGKRARTEFTLPDVGQPVRLFGDNPSEPCLWTLYARTARYVNLDKCPEKAEDMENVVYLGPNADTWIVVSRVTRNPRLSPYVPGISNISGEGEYQQIRILPTYSEETGFRLYRIKKKSEKTSILAVAKSIDQDGKESQLAWNKVLSDTRNRLETRGMRPPMTCILSDSVYFSEAACALRLPIIQEQCPDAQYVFPNEEGYDDIPIPALDHLPVLAPPAPVDSAKQDRQELYDNIRVALANISPVLIYREFGSVLGALFLGAGSL